MLFLVHRRSAGMALIYVGNVGFAFCFWEGRPPCRPVLLLGGTTSVSSGTDVGESDRIISSWRLLDFHVVSKVSVVDTEVDPPEQNSRGIGFRIVSPL